MQTPVAEGDPPKAGEPTGVVPGGRGAKGDTGAKPNRRVHETVRRLGMESVPIRQATGSRHRIGPNRAPVTEGKGYA
jgi:hypothetical protein